MAACARTEEDTISKGRMRQAVQPIIKNADRLQALFETRQSSPDPVSFPVERRRTVVGERLARILSVYGVGKRASLFDARLCLMRKRVQNIEYQFDMPYNKAV
jgi:hypothetical protein